MKKQYIFAFGNHRWWTGVMKYSSSVGNWFLDLSEDIERAQKFDSMEDVRESLKDLEEKYKIKPEDDMAFNIATHWINDKEKPWKDYTDNHAADALGYLRHPDHNLHFPTDVNFHGWEENFHPKKLEFNTIPFQTSGRQPRPTIQKICEQADANKDSYPELNRLIDRIHGLKHQLTSGQFLFAKEHIEKYITALQQKESMRRFLDY